MSSRNIICEEAFAIAKMVDHTSWNLPRSIVPSDIDNVVNVVDDNGFVFYWEMSSSQYRWIDLREGQLRLYKTLVRIARGHALAAICKHGVTPSHGRYIDSRNDVTNYQLLMWTYDGLAVSHIRTDWIEFVENRFFRGPKYFDDYFCKLL